MCSNIYIGNLAAIAELARDGRKPQDAPFYLDLARKGAQYLDRRLSNGQYYEQKVTYRGLRDKSFEKRVAKVNQSSGEVEKLLKRKGPKYQYGAGCISDGVIGAWMARIYGINTPQTRSRTRRNLKAIFRYNFKHDLSNHACTQRTGYALGHEPGLLLCSWPKGGKPTLPFVYSNEVWTGIEYQVASLLIEEGLPEEGLTVVKAARNRYNGRVRNPWNEDECGNYYARTLSSYALLGFPIRAPLFQGKENPLARSKTHCRPLQNLLLHRHRLRQYYAHPKITHNRHKLEVGALYLRGKPVKLNRSLLVRAGKKTTVRI